MLELGAGKSIKAATGLMGSRALANLVLGISTKRFFSPFGLVEKMLWEHSVGVAVASAVVARRFKLLEADEALAAGMMHDIGKTISVFHSLYNLRFLTRNLFAVSPHFVRPFLPGTTISADCHLSICQVLGKPTPVMRLGRKSASSAFWLEDNRAVILGGGLCL